VVSAPEELPPLNAIGVLPVGDHELSLDALEKSYLVTGEWRDEWDGTWRLELVRNLRILVAQLQAVGITEVFADGSFVEDKPHPNDIDGSFVVDDPDLYLSGQLQDQLNRVDPVWIWDPASRRYDTSTGKKQLPMWHKYRVELYPHLRGLFVGSGVRDPHGNEMEFPALFRVSRRNWEPRGIIKIGGLR
jgi:hypothetical protein